MAADALGMLEADSHAHLADTIDVCKTLGTALVALANYPRAAAVGERAVELATVGRTVSTRLVDALTMLGNVYRLQARYDEAEVRLRRAVAAAEQLGLDGSRQAGVRNALGILCKDTGRYLEAGLLYQQALDSAPDSGARANLYHNLAGLAHAQGDYAAAEEPARAAVKLRTSTEGASHPDVAADLAVLGAVLYEQHRYGEAEDLFNHALGIVENRYGPDHDEVAVNLGNLAALYTATGRLGEAERCFRRSLQIRELELGSAHPDIARLLNNLAVLHMKQGRLTDAHTCYRQALSIFDQTLGSGHPTARTCRENYLRLTHGAG